MAYKQTVARPYAKAIFEIARDHGKLAEWGQMIAMAAEIVNNPKISAELAKPKYSAKQRADMVNSIAGDYFNETMRYFIHLLAENRRLPLLDDVLRHFDRYKAQEENILRVKIIAAMEVDDDIEQKLIEALNERYENEVQLKTEVDESLIGGAVLHIGDQVIDGSLKGQLQRMHEHLSA